MNFNTVIMGKYFETSVFSKFAKKKLEYTLCGISFYEIGIVFLFGLRYFEDIIH